MRLERQGFFIGNESGGMSLPRHIPSEVGLEPVFDFLRLGERRCAMPSYIERVVEVFRDDVESFGHFFGEQVEQEASRGGFVRGALAPEAQESSVKYRCSIGHDKSGTMGTQ